MAVLTSTHNLCFEQKYEKYQNFLSEKMPFFLVVKFSVYLNRHVFVMSCSPSLVPPDISRCVLGVGVELHVPAGFPCWESTQVILEGRAVVLAFNRLCHQRIDVQGRRPNQAGH